MAAIIKQCNCKNEYQDKQYGKDRRVFNTKNEGRYATCTVCGKQVNA